MKNLDELALLFPVMEQKRQESTLGGDPYPGGGSGVAWSGTYDPGAVITAYPIPPPPYGTPGFPTSGNTGGGGGYGNGDGGSQGSANPYGVQAVLTPLHQEMVNDLFNRYHFASDLTQAQKDNFKEILGNIDSTKTGDKMLATLDAFYKANPNVSTPTIANTQASSGTYAYSPTQNVLNFSGLLDGNITNSWGIYNAGHEIYHTLEYINGQSPNKINFELDAYMIGAEMVKEAPGDYTSSNLEKVVEASINVEDQTTTPQGCFNSLWDNYINGDYSAGNYANLVGDFQNGAVNGSQYVTYNGQPVTIDPFAVPQFLKDLQN